MLFVCDMEQIETKTVRELIAELQKLDQDKHIWQIYDYFSAWPASINVVDAHIAECAEDEGVKEGDYAFICG